MEELKEAGYWLVGLDEQADKNYTEVDYTSPVGIVLGRKAGIARVDAQAVRFRCFPANDRPGKSLNVSVAAGVVLFEAIRQRNTRSRAK